MTIVASLDFSAVTDRVFETAANLAACLNGRVLLLHVVPPSDTDSVDPVTAATAVMDSSAADQTTARRLARYEKRLQLDRLNVSKVMLRGEPATQILEWSRRLGASFLVIGSHGFNPASDRLLGGTAEGVLRRPPCPVIVVPHPKRGRTRQPWPRSSARA